MDVVIIHMPTHVERWNQMERLMNTIGITSHTYITPVTIRDDDIGAKINRPTRSLYETNIALMESEVTAEAAEAAATPFVLVMEDDVVPTVPPENVLPTIERALVSVANVNPDWDMLYLEYCWESCLLAKTVAPGLIQSRNPLCTAAILYRRDKFPKILSLITPYRKEKQIDRVYKKLIYEGKLNAYSVYPALFRQDTETFPSSLDTFYVKRFFFGYNSCETRMWMKVGMVGVVLVLGVSIVLLLLARKEK